MYQNMKSTIWKEATDKKIKCWEYEIDILNIRILLLGAISD